MVYGVSDIARTLGVGKGGVFLPAAKVKVDETTRGWEGVRFRQRNRGIGGARAEMDPMEGRSCGKRRTQTG